MRLVAAVVAFVSLLPFALAECPKGCSGRGSCNTFDSCDCHNGYTGADCSERICQVATAFVDNQRGDLNHDGVVQASTTVSVAYSKVQWSQYKQYEAWPTVAGVAMYKGSGTDGGLDPSKIEGGGFAALPNEAHFYAECSGKGLCNRQTGSCACFDGYEGGACQRLTCPNDCSRHGMCTPVADIATGGFHEFVDSSYGINSVKGVLNPFPYALWDGAKNVKCVCDAGYTGADCSLRTCPRGDDPLTVTSTECGNKMCVKESQGFTINGMSTNHEETYRITFHDFDGVSYTTAPFMIKVEAGLAVGASLSDAMAENAAGIKTALEDLPMGVTGTVSVMCNTDNTEVKNVRCVVNFQTLSGNVPEFDVIPVTGAPTVAQPSQPVHEFTLDPQVSLPLSAASVSVVIYPDSVTGSRLTEYTSSSVSCSAGNNAALAICISNALQSRASGPPAFVYQFGTSSATVAAHTVSSKTIVTIVMPTRAIGSNAMKLTVGSLAPAISVKDAADGNMEAATCSNRGLCDFSSGLCSCFAGYFGKSCEQQSALAM